MTDQPEVLLRLQADVLEKIAAGAGLDETLEEVCILVEGIVPGSICSTMLLGPDRRLEVVVAPRASADLVKALSGLAPSDMAGSCGTTVSGQFSVHVRDTARDPRWSQLRDAAPGSGIETCWFVPIFSRQEAFLGAFVVAHAKRCEPTEPHEQVLRTASHLAGIAIERNLAEKAVQQAQKLVSLGVLAGGIAHDFNNLLVGILGNTHLAMSQVEPGSPACATVGEIKKASERAAELIKQLLAYAGRGKVSVETVDLGGVMRDMTRLLRSSVPRNIILECVFPDGPLWVKADVTQVRQVGMNLVTNAADSIVAASGTVSVRTGVMRANGAYLNSCHAGGSLTPGVYNFMEIQDSGCGMDGDTIDRIFDPFFTTKTDGRGLGLATTLGIVKVHGGALSIDSKPNAGTTFRVLFPSVRPEAEVIDGHERRKREDVPVPATVLVVDDEEMVIVVTEQMLVKSGYRVLTAESGVDAVKLARELGNELDAVVLDATMPGMDGDDTFLALREIRDDLPVVFCSGHGPIDGAALVEGREQTGFVAKPFSPTTLRQALSALLPPEALLGDRR